MLLNSVFAENTNEGLNSERMTGNYVNIDFPQAFDTDGSNLNFNSGTNRTVAAKIRPDEREGRSADGSRFNIN